MYSDKCGGRNKKWTDVMLTLQNLFPKAFTGKETKRRMHFQKLQATTGAKKAKFEPTLPLSSLPPKATKYCFGGAGTWTCGCDLYFQKPFQLLLLDGSSEALPTILQLYIRAQNGHRKSTFWRMF